MNDFVLGSIGNDLLFIRYIVHSLKEEIKDLSFTDPELVSKCEVMDIVVEESLDIYENILENRAKELKSEIEEHFKEN